VTTLPSADYELAFWGDCLHTLEEEQKHRVYAPLMGIGWNLHGAAVLDIGGGPVSMLLKAHNRGGCAVIDPLIDRFPQWVRDRYLESGIEAWAMRGEDIDFDGYDEAWVYNVLQHVDDPTAVCANARASASVVRVFEWIDIPAYEGHPHELTQDALEEWLGGRGMTVMLAQDGCYGRAFYGVFG